jgi:hypothetical protein
MFDLQSKPKVSVEKDGWDLDEDGSGIDGCSGLLVRKVAAP